MRRLKISQSQQNSPELNDMRKALHRDEYCLVQDCPYDSNYGKNALYDQKSSRYCQELSSKLQSRKAESGRVNIKLKPKLNSSKILKESRPQTSLQLNKDLEPFLPQHSKYRKPVKIQIMNIDT